MKEKKLTQPQILVKYLDANPSTWFKSFELRGRVTPFGFLGHQADRRARKLAELKQIEVRHITKYAEYRAKQPEMPKVLPQYQKEIIQTPLFKSGMITR